MKRLVILALVLGGCTASGSTWYRPETSAEQRAWDQRLCRDEAADMTGLYTGGGIDFYGDCMRGQGYTRLRPGEVPPPPASADPSPVDSLR